jgi:hypothetical protein
LNFPPSGLERGRLPLSGKKEERRFKLSRSYLCIPALPDSGFLRKIWKILADLKVGWQAKTISGGLPISGGFLADWTYFARFCFCLADLAYSGGFGASISKKQFCSHFYLHKKIS